MSNAKIDENGRQAITAVSYVDGVSIVELWADPVTHRLLVDATSFSPLTHKGDIYVYSTTDTRLPVGTNGQVLSADSTTTTGTVTDVAALTLGTTGTDLSSTVANGTTTPVITLNVPTASATNRGALSAADWSTFNAKQAALGFTAENVANKSTSVSTDGASDTKYPSVKAVKDYADGLVAGLLDYRGGYDASVNTFPASGGSGTAGAVLKGDMWIISVAGTLGTVAVQIGDSVIANTDTPGQTAGNWNILNGNISYVPEDVANKVTSISGASTDTQYPSAKLLYDQLVSKAPTANPTFTGTVEMPAIKITTGAGANKVLTSDADGDATWEPPTAGGSALWTAVSGTRASNTTFTVASDVTAIFKKGMIVKWTDTTTHIGMVSIPSTESGGTTTITIIGDVCTASASDFKYCMLGAEMFTKMFAVAGTIGATGTNIANTITAMEPYRLIGADLWVGTAGTTNATTVDINIGGTTAFTTKPTLATTVQSSPTPFTADDDKSLALGDDLTLDVDAVQTTAAIDLYVMIYMIPTRYLSLS